MSLFWRKVLPYIFIYRSFYGEGKKKKLVQICVFHNNILPRQSSKVIFHSLYRTLCTLQQHDEPSLRVRLHQYSRLRSFVCFVCFYETNPVQAVMKPRFGAPPIQLQYAKWTNCCPEKMPSVENESRKEWRVSLHLNVKNAKWGVERSGRYAGVLKLSDSQAVIMDTVQTMNAVLCRGPVLYLVYKTELHSSSCLCYISPRLSRWEKKKKKQGRREVQEPWQQCSHNSYCSASGRDATQRKKERELEK